MEKELLIRSHRPFLLENLNWMISQEWHHTLFVHWPVPASSIREHVPPELEIDTFKGWAWIGIVPFQVKNMRGRYIPSLPFFSSYMEVNVRTYVKFGERSGVYFFSLDANHLLAVTGAKLVFGLAYKQAKIQFRINEYIEIKSIRVPSSDKSAKLKVNYRPETEVFFSEQGTLEHWLTERYCLWTRRGSKLFRGDIHHTKWELQRAQAELLQDILIPFVDQRFLQAPPLLHYNKYKKAFFWPPQMEK